MLFLARSVGLYVALTHLTIGQFLVVNTVAGWPPNVLGALLSLVYVRMRIRNAFSACGWSEVASRWTAGSALLSPLYGPAVMSLASPSSRTRRNMKRKWCSKARYCRYGLASASTACPGRRSTDPELARVGLTEAEARRRGLRIEVFRYPFARDDRAVVDGAPRGLVKLVARAGSEKLLGAQILGPRAGELIQEAILAMNRGLAARHLAETIHVYPTLSMAVQRAAKSWWRARGQGVFAREVLGAYLRLRLRR